MPLAQYAQKFQELFEDSQVHRTEEIRGYDALRAVDTISNPFGDSLDPDQL